MGIDISTHLEVRHGDTWKPALLMGADKDDIWFPLGWRFTDMYSFLSPTQNYKSGCPMIASESRSLPDDSEWLNEDVGSMFPESRMSSVLGDANSWGYNWYTLAELLNFDYNQSPGRQALERERCPGFTMRDFLGEQYFEHLERMKAYGSPEDVRLVFWFG